VFEGYPVKKTEVSENSTYTDLLSKAQSSEYKVVIVKEGDNYYWASRRNTQVVPVLSGYFITFLAVNGSGYIRTLVPEARKIFKQLPDEEEL
jgi:hypothetical protein